ncbi:MAG: hypothetical protein AAGI46_03130 [Planctomycetota bacterium]
MDEKPILDYSGPRDDEQKPRRFGSSPLAASIIVILIPFVIIPSLIFTLLAIAYRYF